MPLKPIIKFFSSLRLTVVLLAFAIILVFVGTVAQADEGLYYAQTRYFKQWFVVGITMFSHRIPLILPGGYLIGVTLLVNLITAHIYRFQMGIKKLGIHVAHAGIILLLVGQLITDLFAHETQVRVLEGQTMNYSESPTRYELAFVTSADAEHNDEVVIPSELLEAGGEIHSDALPFAVRVKSHWQNSQAGFRAPMMQNGPPLTTNGVAMNFDFQPVPVTRSDDDKDAPTAVVELAGPGGSFGDWVVSGWTTDQPLLAGMESHFERQMGPQMAAEIVSRLNQPQSITVGGRQFTFALRPERVYNPFSLTLLKATHSVYQGTDIPKDFRSRVQLQNPQTGENREVEIYMNKPLRYAGLTFYQYQMPPAAAASMTGQVPWSVLQVVHNPTWLTPYIGCVLVATGLLIQFLMHLVRFISKNKTA
jgi:hypothetical protein